jgi:hypothetical protein
VLKHPSWTSKLVHLCNGAGAAVVVVVGAAVVVVVGAAVVVVAGAAVVVVAGAAVVVVAGAAVVVVAGAAVVVGAAVVAGGSRFKKLELDIVEPPLFVAVTST